MDNHQMKCIPVWSTSLKTLHKCGLRQKERQQSMKLNQKPKLQTERLILKAEAENSRTVNHWENK